MRRSARLGTTVGLEGARLAGTKATNVGREPDRQVERLEHRHHEAALKLLTALGQMKGAAMKVGQLASFVDTEFLPEEYRDLYQDALAKLRTSAPAMPFDKVRGILAEQYDDEPLDQLFESFEQEAFAAASVGQVHRATLPGGRPVAVKVQYPGIAAALRADMQNAGVFLRLAQALAPGLDPKAVATELRERVMEELDYELEAQNQRSFERAYRGHPFIYVPVVDTGLTRERVMVSELVEGAEFEQVLGLDAEARSRFGEIVFRFCFGSIYHLQHFNADAHPGNYLLMPDGRVAFLDFGMTKRLRREQIELEVSAVDAVARDNSEALRVALAELGFLADPQQLDAERLLEHVRAVGGWYLTDSELEITPAVVAGTIAALTDPRSAYFDLMRKESLPADELMGRRMETGVLAVLGKLGARRNWNRIAREWWFGDQPATELGRQEWDYFEARGERREPRYLRT